MAWNLSIALTGSRTKSNSMCSSPDSPRKNTAPSPDSQTKLCAAQLRGVLKSAKVACVHGRFWCCHTLCLSGRVAVISPEVFLSYFCLSFVCLFFKMSSHLVQTGLTLTKQSRLSLTKQSRLSLTFRCFFLYLSSAGPEAMCYDTPSPTASEEEKMTASWG